MKRSLTFSDLVSLEPGLSDIEGLARLAAYGPAAARDRVWYSRIKPRLVSLIGYHARGKHAATLGTPEAYDVAYQHLYFRILHEVRTTATQQDEIVF
jgi:hypothetical protein